MDQIELEPNRASQIIPSQGRKSSGSELNELNELSKDTWFPCPELN